MLSLELEDILDDNMDKADEANVSTIVGNFKIMDKADVADVSTVVGVKDVTSKLKFKMNFSGCKRHMLACKTPSPVALEDIAKSRCFLVGLVTGDEWQNDHGDTSHKKTTGDNWQNDHRDDSQGWETGSSCNICSRRLGPKAFTRTKGTQKFKKNLLRGIWCRDTMKKAQKQYYKKVAKYKSNGNWQSSRRMMWRLLISYLEQMRWRSSRRCWKLSDFSGKLIKHSTKFANTLTILPRMCEPQGPLIPRKSAKENWKCPVVN
jgi:hypothetical protein